jgi:glycyl-tRNA synthetase beta chain
MNPASRIWDNSLRIDISGSFMADFLLELGLEEVPDRYLPGLLAGLLRQTLAALESSGVKADGAKAHVFGGPRRLAVLIPGLPEQLPDEMKKGPPVQQAFTAEGKPTPAAEGFAKKLGLAVGDLKKSDDGKFLMGLQKGGAVLAILPQVISGTVKKLDLPKTMRWGAGEDEFIRPLRWLVALLGAEVIPVTLFSIPAGNHSQGPRLYDPILHKTAGAPVLVQHPGEYISALEAAAVLPAPSHRREKILRLLEHAARDAGGRLQPDEELLDKVADLVETPGVIAGNFDPAFLNMPAEILVTAMREHQKNFAVTDAEGKLLPRFLAVIDKPADPTGAIRRGNEAVLKSRLDDARFFYQEDLKTGLDALREKTREINFYAGLGSYFDKSERLVNICTAYGSLALPPYSKDALPESARYCKADLASNLVGEKEFVTLQGLAGGYYALAAGHSEEVASAIADHYLPDASGRAPKSATGKLIALADRVDTLVGFFSQGKYPTGSKDPFALRRAGNQFWKLYFGIGLIPEQSRERIYPDAWALVQAALNANTNYQNNKRDFIDPLAGFLDERLENYYLEQGFSASECASVLKPMRKIDRDPVTTDASNYAIEGNKPHVMLEMLGALRELRDSEALEKLCAAIKRVKNILATSPSAGHIEESKLTEASEKLLAAKCREAGAMKRNSNARQAIIGLSELLSDPLEKFFAKETGVMVMTDNLELRNNRLALLKVIDELFVGLFDPAILAGEARK